jgi:hypothetical protein
MKRLIAALAAFVAVYLLAGFVAWNWDASDWHPLSRFYTALFGSVAAGLAATFPGSGG